MRALLLDRPGKPNTLRLGDIPDPTPGPGELLVRVRAVGLNPVDYKLGEWGPPGWTWPHVLGLDVAGEVAAVGDGVTGFHRGDRVFYHGDLSRQGGFAELTVTVAHVVAAIPASVSFEAAAALPCAGFTAWQAVHDRLRVQAGQTVLVLGAAGGVGGFAVQLARHAGGRVLAVCSDEKAAFVRALGAAEVIDYRRENVPARARELTQGRGVDAAVDAVSSESATLGLQALAYAGGLASVAGRPNLAAVPPFGVAPSVHEIALGACYSHGDRASQARLAVIGTEMARMLADGQLDPMVSRVLSFEEIPFGLAELAGRRATGKLVARVG